MKMAKDIMENYPEYSSPTLVCTEWSYEGGLFLFYDEEEDKQHLVTHSDVAAALLHDVGKPFVAMPKKDPRRKTYVKHDLLGVDIVRKYAAHLKWSKGREEAVVDLVLNHMREDSPLREADLKAH